jgi:hypothetical protein
MLDTRSSLIVTDDEYVIHTTNEADNALYGILAEVRQIADRYVLLGELRGDLMTASGEFASTDLQAINRFEVSAGNEYVDKRAYYHIINNCNFLLQKLDTALTVHTEKVLLPHYAITKAIRAWTYFQLGQIYGKATYCSEPVLDLEASLVNYPVIALDELVDKLIADLTPYAALPVSSLAVPVPVLLADLYLYKNDYQKAANLYYDVITGEYNAYRYTIGNYVNRWLDVNQDAFLYGHPDSYGSEVIASIVFDGEAREQHSQLVNLSYNDRPAILPAANYVQFMRDAVYLYASVTGVITPIPSGDLRGNIKGQTLLQSGDAYNYVDVKGNPNCLIYKYYSIANSTSAGYDPDNNLLPGLHYLAYIPIYRELQLYLRFAEAVNRAGKPTLAFAVLKYGLTYANVNDPRTAKVNPGELGERYTRIPQNDFFDGNIATASRGRGSGIPIDTVFFKIPLLPAQQDSIEWVEDRILEELAAETPFEGNRFFDLLCVSRRRANHPEYMAEKVAAKYSDPEAMKARLRDLNNWFLP